MKKRRFSMKRLNQTQFIAAGFAAMIFIGMCLLMLPISSRTGEWTGPLEALFTSTSSSCVTGLVAYDTFTHWSFFGQIVILCLIQIGGLGFITIGVGLAVVFRRQIGLRQRDLLKESVNAIEIGGIIRLWKSIVRGTFIFEGVGAALLSIRFIPEFGVSRGIFFSVFHSISAFCNAGFDLMGIKEEYASLASYISDPLVNLVIIMLIIIGSLGFMVWRDLWQSRFRWKNFNLHTKLVVTVTLVLVFGGAILMYITERNRAFAGMDVQTKVLSSLFSSVTTRTAGFNTADFGAFSPAGRIIAMLLMFIGGSPGSTAGGIKTTTFAVLVLYVVSKLRNRSGCNVYHRRISDEVVKKASMVFMLNFNILLLASVIILATTNLAMDDVLFEAVSAVSTVGLTTGITRSIGSLGMLVITLLMYIGRTGSMTFALSFMHKPHRRTAVFPEEKIAIG